MLQPFAFSKRRSKLEIYIEVLKIIDHGISRPTRIMYAANISWNLLNDILNSLEKKGLIERKTIRGHSLFFLTNKGREMLKTIENIF
ncbi:MAG: winged helix-turn-helix domain-containing protein [Candidatus Bathyarchaeia archaeon]